LIGVTVWAVYTKTKFLSKKTPEEKRIIQPKIWWTNLEKILHNQGLARRTFLLQKIDLQPTLFVLLKSIMDLLSAIMWHFVNIPSPPTGA